MFYQLPLSGAAMETYQTMPKDIDGAVKSLFYIPAGRLPKYEAEWREWCKAHPKHEWPAWIEQWGLKKKQEKPR